MSNRLLDYLPPLYQTDPFLSEFLKAFEKILLGRPDNIDFKDKGLEQTIAQIPNYFNPIDENPIDSNNRQETPEEFLSWLASWTALSLRADLAKGSQRKFIVNIVKSYRFRGTKVNLQRLLEIFLSATPSVVETEEAHHFSVIISLPADVDMLGRQLDIAHAIIELEKPAHTDYDLDFRFPSMRVGDPDHPRRRGSRLGIDTVIGTIPDQEPPEDA